MWYKYTVNNVYAFLLLNKLKQCTTKLLNISSTKKEQPFIQKKIIISSFSLVVQQGVQRLTAY